MADSIMTYEEIEALYKKGSYKKSMDSALARLAEYPTESKTYLLYAKSHLFRIAPEESEKNKKTILDAIKLAATNCSSIEEAFAVETEFCAAISQWKKMYVMGRLGKLLKNPTFENYKLYYPMFPKFIEFDIYTQITVRNTDWIKAAAEAEGLKLVDFAGKYATEPPEAITDLEIKELEFNTANQIYENAKAMVESEGDAVGDYVQKVAETAVTRLLVAHLLMDHSIPEEGKENDIPSAVLLESLKTDAEVLHYLLSATISPNGQTMSLYQGDREDYLSDFDAIIIRISKIDPSYVAPLRPSRYAIGAASSQNSASSTTGTSSTTSSGGGCYVATCVYGSYDCPQVWTLRRYRDNTLSSSPWGRAFIRLYYAVSPTLVKWFGDTDWFKSMWKGKLDSMVSSLQSKGVADTPYEDKPW